MGSDVATEKPDLESHSLIRFLDKFAYRNPKTKELTRGGSIMQPLQATTSVSDTLLRSKSGQAAGASVNNASFWAKKIENVAAEDAFFHEYFHQIGRTGGASTRRTAPKSEADKEDEDEDEVWKALTSGQGEDEADLDDDLEGGMADGDDSEDDLPDWDSSSQSDGGVEIVDEDGQGLDGGEDEFMAVASDSEAEAGGDADGGKEDAGKADKSKAEKRKSRRKQLRELPMFASVDDYAELLAQEADI